MGLKVLLADDETEYVDTLAERLELRDYSVRVVHDGISALTAVEEDMPDVVVLDLFMPGLPATRFWPNSTAATRNCPSSSSRDRPAKTAAATARRSRPTPA